jgi:type II secretory ATPase GspE/PulE/Tfp pilus assembly ATPase PilB-like protein
VGLASIDVTIHLAIRLTLGRTTTSHPPPSHPTAAALDVVPEQLARRARLLPLILVEGVLHVATEDVSPTDVGPEAGALDVMMIAADAQEVVLHRLHDVDARILRAYGARRLAHLVEACSDDAVAVLDALLDEAAGYGASDLHLDATPEGLWVRRRIDGELHDVGVLDAGLRVPMLARIKVRAGLDAAERRLPQDGRFEHETLGGALDVRVATLPTRHGERATLRLLARDARAADLELLGLPTDCVAAIVRASDTGDGLIIVCGPTGSGKTTTLHAVLARLTRSRRNIVTLEDPIERVVPGTSQTQIDASLGLTFAAGLRHLLRHDPDVMLVGEIRDSETALLAVEAAHTGHLVLASLHAVDAPSAFARLVELGAPVPLVAETLRLIVAQRLLAVPCPHCGGASSRDGRVGRDGRDGCDGCDGRGTVGRSAVAETIELDDELRVALRADDGPAARHAALVGACRPRLRDIALARAQAGLARHADATQRTPSASAGLASAAPGGASGPRRYPRQPDL